MASEAEPDIVGRAVSPCNATGYVAFFGWANSIAPWYINRGSIDASDLNRDNAVSALRESNRNITYVRTGGCDIPDNFNRAGEYQGDTDRGTNLQIDPYRCPGGDGVSVVAFGPLPPTGDTNPLAATCTYKGNGDYAGDRGYSAEGDIRFDRNVSWTTADKSDCNNQYNLEDTATHEFGHFWGLGHVGVGEVLTMTGGGSAKCDYYKSTLALGDARGVNSLG